MEKLLTKQYLSKKKQKNKKNSIYKWKVCGVVGGVGATSGNIQWNLRLASVFFLVFSLQGITVQQSLDIWRSS